MNAEFEALFEAARKLTSAPARKAFLDAACVEQPELRHQLEQLLATQREADELFESGAAAMREALPLAAEGGPSNQGSDQPGERIGRYKLLQRLGEGGCGVVYMAEQDEPVRRRVALKIIKLGMDTKSVIARFEAERQALAMMDHPSIAKVLDGGATGTGRPYFVMELVRGIKITDYCDENQLPIRERLELFIQVCQAVQHAHQKGIIHRDLKPSNILVTVNDGRAIPKVIDFGVAKAIEQRLTEKTLFTAFEQVIGTPAYMSPEQAAMTSLDIDTRSDIYSLGVLLYELLAGETPFDPTTLLQAGVEEMRRTIREREPPRPSLRVKTLVGEELTTTAKRRRTEGLRLIHLLRGDLDWIAMKCLEKDRTRRYETANGLALDIQRFLHHEPVIARPPGHFYRLQKWMQRNKFVFAAGAAVIATLLLGLVFGTWFLIRTLAAEREQGRSLAKAERAERDGWEKLRESRLAQARANRRSPLAGRRLQSLEALHEAAAIPLTGAKNDAALSLRNETIACLALPDLAAPRVVGGTNSGKVRLNFDSALERYALVDEAGVVHLRRLANDEELWQMPAVTNGVSFVRGFSPDGRFLAVVFHGRHLRVWDLEQQAVVLALDSENSGQEAIFGPGSGTVAVTTESGDGSIELYELPSGKLLRRLKAGSGPMAVRFSADGAFLAAIASSSYAVEILEIDSGRIIARLPHSMTVHTVAWHPDNRLLAVGCHDLRLYLWNPLTGQRCGALAGHRSVVVGAAFHPSGRFLASTSWDGTTRLWDVATSEQLLHLDKAGTPIQFSRDGRRLAMVTFEGSQLVVCDFTMPRTWRGLVDLSFGLETAQYGGYYTAAFSSDERFLIAAGHQGAHWWSLQTDRSVDLPGIGEAYSALIHPRRNELIITQPSGLSRWRLESTPSQPALTVFASRTRDRQGSFGRATISRSGALFAYARSDHVSLERDGRSPLRLTGPSPPNILAISPNERWLAAGAWPGRTTSLWDTDSGARRHDFDMAQPPGIAFSPDSRWLVIASGQDYVFFDVATGEKGRCLSVDKAGALAFSHDGRLLAISVRQSLVKLLDATTFEELATLETSGAPMITHLAFSPSDTQILVAGGGQAVQLWDLRVLRAELAARNLDWSHPPYPTAPALQAPAVVKVAVRPVIPLRPDEAGPNLIDLTKFYTAALSETWGEFHNNLAGLAPGLHTLGGIRYDVRGTIHLRGGRLVYYASEVTGIQISQRGRRLHFLGGIGLAPIDGETVATNRIHYADGQITEVPVIVGRDSANWWFRPGESADGLDVAWIGTNGASKSAGYKIRLLHSVWTNPRPDVSIDRVDYVSARSSVAPFLVAITVE